MILYLAGAEQERPDLLKQLTNCNLLFSYMFNPSRVVDIPHNQLNSLSFVDSGAFSAWTQQKSVDTDKYINWLNDNCEFIDLYGQVDTIPGTLTQSFNKDTFYESAKKSWENYLYMRPQMKNPDGLLYTYHAGEPLSYLKNALEWVDDNGKPMSYIALAGVVGNPRTIRKRFFEECFNIIRQSSNPNVKVHAFGLTDFSLLEQFPITSSDSTSWIIVGAMGNIMSDYGVIQISGLRRYNRGHFVTFSSEMRKNIIESVTKFGFTIEELMDSRDKRIMYNGLYLMDKVKTLDNLKHNKVFKKKLF